MTNTANEKWGLKTNVMLTGNRLREHENPEVLMQLDCSQDKNKIQHSKSLDTQKHYQKMSVIINTSIKNDLQ